MADPLMAVVGTGSAESVGNQNWLGEVYTASTSSDGKSSGFPDENEGDPPVDNYWCEKATSFITTSGNPMWVSETQALEMKFAQSIGNHYWITSIIGLGAPGKDFATYQYCPIFTQLITGITFNWKRYCNGDDTHNSGKGKHRFRVFKVGMVVRDSENSVKLIDMSWVGSTPQLFDFKSGTYSGTQRLNLRNGIRASQVVGLYFQLETEGGGGLTTSGSWIKIWNLDIYCNSNKIILPKKAVYPKLQPNPGNYLIQTYQ